MKKHEYFRDQAETARQNSKSGRQGGDKKHNNAIPIKQNEMEEKVKDYAFKVSWYNCNETKIFQLSISLELIMKELSC